MINLRNIKIAHLNLRDIFANHLLKSGYLYYKTGHVKEIIKDNDRYLGVTQDEEGIHQVMIDFLTNRINFSCDCPDLISSPCKHIIACACAIKDKEKITPIEIDLKVFPKTFKQYVKKVEEKIEKAEQSYQPYNAFQDFFKRELALLDDALLDNEEEVCQKVFYLFSVLSQVEIDLLKDSLSENILSLNSILRSLLVNHSDFIMESSKWYSKYNFAITLEDIFSLMANKVSTYLEAEKLMDLLNWINQDGNLENHETYLLAKIKLNYEYLDKSEALKMINGYKDEYTSVLDYYIHQRIKEERVEEVIVELEELRKQEHLMEEHAYLLLELYQNKNEQAKFNDLAEFIFYQAPTYDCYNILKSNVSKVKFQVKKEKYLEALFNHNVNDYYRVIKQEKDLERLFNFYLQGGLEVLNNHASEFDSSYQEKIINNNITYVKANIPSCKSENEAMNLMYYIFQIQDILGTPLGKSPKLLGKIKRMANGNEHFKRVFISCLTYLK